MLMAQYGADVVKIEPPEGDWARHLGRPFGDHTAFSIAGNLGKRSVVLDLKTEGDKEVLWRLLEDADVFFEGFRPGVISRLGFSYELVEQRNPRILYVSVSGFGQSGPLSKKPAMDPVLQAFTGFMAANRDTHGTPQRSGPIIVDMTTALYAFQAVSAALFARQHEAHGRRIEVSLMEAAANLQCVRMMQTHLLGEQPPSATAPSGAFRCSDGYIFVVVFRQADFVRFCDVVGLPKMAADAGLASPQARFERMDEVNQAAANAFLKHPAAYWCEKLTDAGLQNEQVLEYTEFLQHPHVTATGAVAWLSQPGVDVPVPMTNVPGAPRMRDGERLSHAPTLGEHTESVFAEIRGRDGGDWWLGCKWHGVTACVRFPGRVRPRVLGFSGLALVHTGLHPGVGRSRE
jgi:crotonobetainyl-CoA:carnitine CoA-transferase CaiB-like acyl-CoA transferase